MICRKYITCNVVGIYCNTFYRQPGTSFEYNLDHGISIDCNILLLSRSQAWQGHVALHHCLTDCIHHQPVETSSNHQRPNSMPRQWIQIPTEKKNYYRQVIHILKYENFNLSLRTWGAQFCRSLSSYPKLRIILQGLPCLWSQQSSWRRTSRWFELRRSTQPPAVLPKR